MTENNKPVEETPVKKNFAVRFKEKVDKKVEGIGRFLKENPQIIMPLMSGLGMLLAGGVKIASNAGEKRLEKCRVEDDVTGAEFTTKHPLTNDEILELGGRMIDGQWKGDALNEMDLLR